MSQDFTKGQVVNVKDPKDSKFYKAKIVDTDSDLQLVKVHFVGWNSRHDEVIPLSSARVTEWRSGELLSSDAAGACTGDAPLNADTVAGGSTESGVQDSAGFLSVGAGAGKFQQGSGADLGKCCGFCDLPLSSLYVVCSGCQKFFHPDTLCMGVEDNVIAVLLDDKVGAINFCCCECRMVSAEDRGPVKDVSAGYAQLLRVVGCLVSEVRNLKDSRLGMSANHIGVADPSKVKLHRQIFLEMRFSMK